MPGLGSFYDQMLAAAMAVPEPEQLAGLRRQLAARAGHDVVAELPAITQPTLVCAGRYDDIAPMENSELLAETLGEHVFDFFLRNKRAEWDEYRGQVSAFERDQMLPVL